MFTVRNQVHILKLPHNTMHDPHTSALKRVPLKELTRKQLCRLLGSKAYNKNVCKKTYDLQQLVAASRSPHTWLRLDHYFAVGGEVV